MRENRRGLEGKGREQKRRTANPNTSTRKKEREGRRQGDMERTE